MSEIVLTNNTEELERLEGVIKKNIGAFYEVGRALMEIRDKKYYSDVLGFETFEAYCTAKWDMSKMHAYRLMDSCRVIDTVKSNQLVTPYTESQCRPLAKLEPDQQREAWKTVIETAPEGKITARLVSKVVNDVLEINIADHGDKTKRNIIKTQKDDIVDEDLKKAYEAFYWQVQNAKLEKWANTSKQACLQMVGWINDLIEV